jgi:hypothetical protein
VSAATLGTVPAPALDLLLGSSPGDDWADEQLAEQRAVVRGLLMVHADECERADALADLLTHLTEGCGPVCGGPRACRDRATAALAAHRRARAELEA